MPRLVVERGPNKGKSVTLPKQWTSCSIGREPTGPLRLPIQETLVSRQHCRLECRPDGVYVVDCGSLNGTRCNGKPIKEAKLSVGDRIEIGEAIISFLADQEVERRSWPIGHVIDGYEVQARVGSGGMGTVYRAMQLSLRRTVALKLLSPELAEDQTFIRLFFREARAAAAFNHPNIVQIYDFGRADKVFYFSMEYMPGGSLQDLLTGGQRIPWKEALAYARDAARGLAYAETKKIIHRDIKPDNLMLGEERIVKIGDLGLAKSETGPAAGPERQGVFGTPHFIAPEQALNKNIDHRVDIYSLGSSLFRMISGSPPFTGASVREIILAKVKTPPPRLTEIEPSVPEAVAALVYQMMERNVEDRPPTAEAVLAAIDRVREQCEGTVRASTGLIEGDPPSVEIPDNPMPSRKPLWIGIGAAGLLLAGGLTILPFLPKTEDPPPKPPPIRTNPPPRDNGEAIQLRRQLVEMRMSAAEAINNNRPADDLDALAECRAAYEAILVELPDNERADEIRHCLAKLAEEEKGIVARRDLSAAAEEMRRDFELLAQAENATALQDAGEAFAARWIEEYRRLAEAHADTPEAGKATARRESMEAWRTAFQSAGEAYGRIETKLARLLESSDYPTALQAILRFREEYANTGYDRFAAHREKEIRGAYARAFEDSCRDIDRLIEEGRLEDAEQRIARLERDFPFPEAIAHAASRKEEVARERKLRNEDQFRRQQEADKIALLGAQRGAVGHAADFRLGDAARTLQEAVEAMSTEDIRKETRMRLREYQAMQSLFEAWQDRIRSGKNSSADGGLDSRIFRKVEGQVLGEVIDAGKDGLVIHLLNTPPGNNSTWYWKDMRTGELHDSIVQGWSPSGRESFALGILCMRFGPADAARRHFEAAGEKSPELLAETAYYLERVDRGEAEADRERCAMEILSAADKIYESGQKRDAKSLYRALKNLYYECEAFREGRRRIVSRSR